MIQTQSDKGFEIKCLLKYHNCQEKAIAIFFSHHLEIKFESLLDQSQDRTLSLGSEHLTINYHKIRGINFPERSSKSQKIEIFVENDQLVFEMTISDSYIVKQYLRPRVPQLDFFKNYKILETISTGGQGKVVKCLCNENKQIYAAKIVQKFGIYVKREVDNLKLLSQYPCKYVIQMFEYYEEQNLVILVFPYLSGGTLKKYMTLMKEHNKVLNVQKIMKQILTGLHFIHSIGLIHRDIKLDNIMVQHDAGENEIIKIIDFGFSVRINSTDLINERCGTVGYLAPEMANQERYDQRCDIYSLGQVFHILLTGNPMYGKGMQNLQIINLTKDYQLKIDTHSILCSQAIELLSNMINQESQRFTASKCLNHKYFGKMFFSEILNNLKSVLFRQKFQSRL